MRLFSFSNSSIYRYNPGLSAARGQYVLEQLVMPLRDFNRRTGTGYWAYQCLLGNHFLQSLTCSGRLVVFLTTGKVVIFSPGYMSSPIETYKLRSEGEG